MNEIEVKSLLTEQKYDELRKVLPQKFKKINEDTITTVKFKPKDVRVRYSDKINELVFKDADPTTVSRKEVTVNLQSLPDAHAMIAVLKEMGFQQDPSWVKRKEEFLCRFGGNEYTLSLQFIENFAYLLEAEIISDKDDVATHLPNLKKILSDLGCEPIEPQQFKVKIEEYIKNNSKK